MCFQKRGGGSVGWSGVGEVISGDSMGVAISFGCIISVSRESYSEPLGSVWCKVRADWRDDSRLALPARAVHFCGLPKSNVCLGSDIF